MRASDLDPAKAYAFTVGHSNISFERLLDLLRSFGIEAVVDVRSQPFSRHTPHFNEHALRVRLKEASIDYDFMGRELGGRPAGLEFYDDQGHVRYDKWSEDPKFLEGIRILEDFARQRPTAILCAEAKPQACHRHLLVARVLASRGWPKSEIVHINSDGSCVSEDSFPAQQDLFGGSVSWRSPQSVLHKVLRSTSSNESDWQEFSDS